MTPWGRRLLFPPQSLADLFGPDDTEYGIRVFLHHYRQLADCGFRRASRILEVGPGRNVVTALLMWALNQSRCDRAVNVALWDLFPNISFDADCLKAAARALLQAPALGEVLTVVGDETIPTLLTAVERGETLPEIRYRVGTLSELTRPGGKQAGIALLYSHAAIEHVWNVSHFWRAMVALTKPGGWHSHRIDLADHGRRETNYIEMLEWSPMAYWLTMRFVPGAVNRWRASAHVEFARQCGLEILGERTETRPDLPIPRARISQPFRSLSDIDLRTTALDLVAVKPVGAK